MKKYVLGIMVFALALIAGCGSNEKKVEEEVENTVRTFADWTDNELFADVPVMLVDRTEISDVFQKDTDVYSIEVHGTTTEDYQQYLVLLEENGYVKYADNGSEGINGDVYHTTFLDGESVLMVLHMVRVNKTTITVAKDMQLSEHLNYKEEYLTENKEGAKTTLHMQEVFNSGNSFIFQLKNGHFILNDGGTPNNAVYLLEYLESLVPEGEKPIVDAWFLSHPHDDHEGFFTALTDNMDFIERIAIEGVYFTAPATDVVQIAGTSESHLKTLEMAIGSFKKSNGEKTALYRPQTGQRYYFSDVIVDIVLSCDSMKKENYEHQYNDLNSSSLCLMYHIEEQTMFLGGDFEHGNMTIMAGIYKPEYFQVDIFTAPHHGHVVSNLIADTFKMDLLLYPAYGSLGIYYQKATYENNLKLHSKAKEVVSFGGGTVTLEFPYQIGSYKVQSPQDWKYHDNELRTWTNGTITDVIEYNRDGSIKGVVGKTIEYNADGTIKGVTENKK